MLTRLIGVKPRDYTWYVEQHFLVTQNWGMGSTIGVVLIVAMIILMFITRDRRKGGYQNEIENNSKWTNLYLVFNIRSFIRSDFST